MAEFAAAASGAGLASLGIQCCKGLIDYYSSYKASNEQVGATHEEIEVLTSLFEKLERVLSRDTADQVQESYVQQVDRIITLCRGRLQRLQSVLEKCQSIALPNSTSDRLQKIKSQALFPFKEQTLLTLRENVQSLRGDLQLALHVFQTDMELEQKQKIASLAAVSRDVGIVSQNTRSEIQAMAAPIYRMSTRFDQLLQQGEDTTTKLSEIELQMRQYHEIALNLGRTMSDQYSLLSQQDRSSSRSFEHDFITALGEFGIERDLLRNGIKLFSQKRDGEAQELAARMDVLNRKITELQLSAIRRPSLLQSACLENNRLADHISRLSELEVDTRQGQLPFLSRRRTKCNCNARYAKSPHGKALWTSRYGQLFGYEWLRRSATYSTRSHHLACPMYSSSPNVATAQFSIGICGALLNGAVETSISLIRGAGGFSISSKLHCLRVVSRQCKVFSLARIYADEVPSMSDIRDWEAFLDRKTQEIELLFQGGQATPHDVDLEGNTLLHIAGNRLDDDGVSDLAGKTGLSHEVILSSLVAFCERLRNLGVPLNWVSHEIFREKLFVQPLIEKPPSQLNPDVLSDSLNRLCRMGLEITSSFLDTGVPLDPMDRHYYQVIPAITFPKCHDVIDGLCSNEIHEAILHRSATRLQRALQRLPKSIDESNDAGYTPLHLASNWPCGLSLLLSQGADMEKMSRFREKPVLYAILQGCTEAVQQLLRAGCSFDLGSVISQERNVLAYAVRLLHVPAGRLPTPTLHNRYFEIVKIIIEELVLRRHSLIPEMINASSAHQSEVSISDNNQILDPGTVQAENPLRSVNGTAPQLRSILPANELWSAGFREIDMPDDRDKTPLMVLRHEYSMRKPNNISDTLEFAFWLYQKGASLRRLYHATPPSDSRNAGNGFPILERRAIHFISAALNSSLFREFPGYLRYYGNKYEYHIIRDRSPPARLEPFKGELSLGCRQLLHRIMLDDSPDGCHCACSVYGCLPVTYFLKRGEIIPTQFIVLEKGEAQKKCQSLWSLDWLFGNVPSDHFPVAVSRAIVRLMTFENLGIRHTCCRYINSRFWEYDSSLDFESVDPEEADELRDEDCKGIQLLESLLPEFEEKRGDEDIKSFLGGYWATRMKEVLAARDTMPVDEAGIREAGVTFRNSDGGSDDDWCYD